MGPNKKGSFKAGLEGNAIFDLTNAAAKEETWAAMVEWMKDEGRAERFNAIADTEWPENRAEFSDMVKDFEEADNLSVAEEILKLIKGEDEA